MRFCPGHLPAGLPGVIYFISPIQFKICKKGDNSLLASESQMVTEGKVFCILASVMQ